jgi:hypothetical protein
LDILDDGKIYRLQVGLGLRPARGESGFRGGRNPETGFLRRIDVEARGG